jgi:hypothetical protein
MRSPAPLNRAGVPALLDREMAYKFTVDATGHSGQLYVAVSPPGLPAWFKTGTWSDPPPNSGASVVANWWFNGLFGVVKLSTSIGSISYGTVATTVYTSRLSLLGTLFGGNADNNFAFFNRGGVWRRRAGRHPAIEGSRVQIETTKETQGPGHRSRPLGDGLPDGSSRR